ASCAGSSYGSYCCDGKCQTAECPLPNTCTDDASCAGSSYGSYCCDGKCQTAECPLPNTCTDDAGCTNSTYGQYCCGGACQQAECNAVAITGLNDTGIATKVDSSSTQEDASFGRDFTHNNNTDGHAGFSFTKLSATGGELAANAPSWSCVKDNATGLIWETNANPTKLSWYNSDSKTNGGSVGDINNGNNTQNYAANANIDSLCGYNSGWRVPTIKELVGLVNSSKTAMAANQDYFPGINADHRFFWSATPSAESSSNAWGVTFDQGYADRLYAKTNRTSQSIMLVRTAE
ncbi:DUF1566 domain-containing protein, partial [Candidatus Electronema sp. JC]|uniref:Lcl C-terminal domain-containing protein n=1 Tax=Candidatus Electronema sp. JC TaxID=3401570 RepID=UPI003B4381FE